LRSFPAFDVRAPGTVEADAVRKLKRGGEGSVMHESWKWRLPAFSSKHGNIQVLLSNRHHTRKPRNDPRHFRGSFYLRNDEFASRPQKRTNPHRLQQPSGISTNQATLLHPVSDSLADEGQDVADQLVQSPAHLL